MGAVALVPSRHAREVMEARGVLWGEVVAAVRCASLTDTTGERTRYFHDDLCVVVASDGTVVTVLWRASHQWTDAQVRRRGTPD